MSEQENYEPPLVWKWKPDNNQAFGNINRPTAGAQQEKELQVGKHPLQLYSLATPNGIKVTVMLEELLEKGHSGAEYDAWLINIGDGSQFDSGFVAANPNSKIPALVDYSGDEPLRVFESGAILLYLAEKFGEFIPSDHAGRTECLNWLFLANGRNSPDGRRIWSFLRLRTDQNRIRYRPLHYGGKAPTRSARSNTSRATVHCR